jgi:hypothetical protein
MSAGKTTFSIHTKSDSPDVVDAHFDEGVGDQEVALLHAELSERLLLLPVLSLHVDHAVLVDGRGVADRGGVLRHQEREGVFTSAEILKEVVEDLGHELAADEDDAAERVLRGKFM